MTTKTMLFASSYKDTYTSSSRSSNRFYPYSDCRSFSPNAIGAVSAENPILQNATYTDLRASASVNENTASHTVQSTVNGSAGNCILTFGAGVTGEIHDTTHSDSLTAGDGICWYVAPTLELLKHWDIGRLSAAMEWAGSVAEQPCSSWDSNATNTINFGVASVTRYSPFRGCGGGGTNSYSSLESDVNEYHVVEGALSNLQIYITTNGNSNDATQTSRVNGADGNQTYTITATVTGLFEDATHSDAITAGDYTSVKTVTGAGTVNAESATQTFRAIFTSDAKDWGYYSRTFNESQFTGLSLATSYYSPPTDSAVYMSSSSTAYAHVSAWSMSASRLRLHQVVANSSSYGTCWFQVNGSDGNQTVAATAGTTGFYSDSTHSDYIAVDDTFQMRSQLSVATSQHYRLGVSFEESSTTGGDITQVAVEVLRTDAAVIADITQVAVEALRTDTTVSGDVTQLAVEVLRPSDAPTGLDPADPHRYWRLYLEAGLTNYGTIREVAFRSAVQGPTRIGAGTPSADTVFSGTYTADKAIDGNTTTYWCSTNTAFPHWWKYDFGAGNDVDIIEVLCTWETGYKPTGTLYLQYSDDDTNWYDRWTIPLWTQVTNFAYPYVRPPTTKQLWRINITDSQDHAYVYMPKLKMRDVESGADLCVGGTAQANEDYALGGYDPSKAFDSDPASYWSTQSDAAGAGWIGYAFTSPVEIVEVEMTARNITGTGMPLAFSVDYWDGSSWVTKWSTTTPATWSSSETRTFTYVEPVSGARPVVFCAT
jgi:hypothetical protein